MRRRTLLVAKRDYLAAIRSKAFLFGLIGAPILFGSGFIGMAVMKVKPDVAERRVVVLDHTGVAAAPVCEAILAKSGKERSRTADGQQKYSAYQCAGEAAEEANIAVQRLALSDRIRRREIFAFLEIGRDAVHPAEAADPEKLPPASRIDYYSNANGIDQTRGWLSDPVSDGLRAVRLAELGVDRGRFAAILAPAAIQTMSLLDRDPKTGAIQEAHKKSETETFVIPFVLMMMLAMMVLMSAGPMLGAVADDKQQRVFEMLLASASPFELMAGKMFAAVALTLTSSVFYIAASLFVLQSLAMLGLAPLGVLPWFFVYMIADVMVISSLAIAVGSACASPNDAQHLAMLVLAPSIIPLMLIAPILQSPNGAMATAMSFIPPFTPLIMLMRQAMPGGVPVWQPWVALLGVIAWTFLATWAAARIFRIAILVQGKTAKVSELVRWAVRG